MQIRLTRNLFKVVVFVGFETLYYACLIFVKIINTLKLSFRGIVYKVNPILSNNNPFSSTVYKPPSKNRLHHGFSQR